jgi:hypothetical protein
VPSRRHGFLEAELTGVLRNVVREHHSTGISCIAPPRWRNCWEPDRPSFGQRSVYEGKGSDECPRGGPDDGQPLEQIAD